MPGSRTVAGSPAPVQGILWMVASCVFFAAMTGFIRHLSATVEPLEIVFFRNLFGMIVMLPWLLRHGFPVLRTRRLPLHALRALVCLVAMTSWYIVISYMNLADAVALSFTAPLFATVAAVFLLGEMLCLHRAAATFIGFVGAMVILRPGFQEISPLAIVALLSALMMAVASILGKILSRTESTGAIVFYLALFLTPASLIPALAVWHTPTFDEFLHLIAIGGTATLCHVCVIRAFAVADASAVLPFDFVRLPLIAIIGYFVFGEHLDVWTGVGATIIIGASVYIARREARRRSGDPIDLPHAGTLADRPPTIVRAATDQGTIAPVRHDRLSTLGS